MTHKKPKYYNRYEHRQCLTNINHGENPDSKYRDSHERLGSVTKTMPEPILLAMPFLYGETMPD